MLFIHPPRTPGVRKALMLTLFTAVIGLGSTAWAADPQVAHPLVGRWKVASINGAPPPKFLAGQVLVIQADAQVVNLDLSASGAVPLSESSVQKALKDALMRGTWRAAKGQLYVSNSPRRDTGSAYTITQQGKLLSLDPDPYFSNADVPSKATYERLR
ncbi:hypothetical protein [Acidovorax sp.]|uniref:hypothetical protein n=1 Tax=Acidovorax sp. TaxID=1872122 RepID=UPI00391D0C39